jgi:hypothetical protein
MALGKILHLCPGRDEDRLHGSLILNPACRDENAFVNPSFG